VQFQHCFAHLRCTWACLGHATPYSNVCVFFFYLRFSSFQVLSFFNLVLGLGIEFLYLVILQRPLESSFIVLANSSRGALLCRVTCFCSELHKNHLRIDQSSLPPLTFDDSIQDKWVWGATQTCMHFRSTTNSWLCAYNVILTNKLQHHYNLVNSPIYQRRGTYGDDAHHFLMDCAPSNEVWQQICSVIHISSAS